MLTNYHVVSQMALDPDVYIGEYVDTDGKSGPIELLAVDVGQGGNVLEITSDGAGDQVEVAEVTHPGRVERLDGLKEGLHRRLRTRCAGWSRGLGWLMG